MCGILGYLGPKNASRLVHDGLKRLSYRGYDSWGLAALTHGSITLYKQVGDIEQTAPLELPSTTVIGHTRWATHGAVTVQNAHPHTNESGTISVVHNGIIENYELLRLALSEEGYIFKSQTDTEVIPHLIDYYINHGRTFASAFERALHDLHGSYAILALHTDGTLCFARNGSPLVIGLGKNEHYISSDIPSFLEHTKEVMYLEDGDHGVLNGSLQLFNSGKKVERAITTVPYDVDVAKRGNHPHFMIKEIEEQQRTIPAALNQNAETIARAVQFIKQTPHLVLVGCGTSYNTCAAASTHFISAGRQTTCVIGSEFASILPVLNKETLVLAVSQSGETADVLDSVKAAQKKGCTVIALTNVPSSTLARLSSLVIPLGTGPELCVLATKTATAQLAVLTLLALELAGKDKQCLIDTARDVRGVLAAGIEHAKSLSGKLKHAKSLFILGRGQMNHLAREAALKIKEVSYIHAEGMPGGELKHGSIALIEPGTPVIVLSDDSTRQLMASNAQEVRARGAYVIGIDSQPNTAYDYHIAIPERNEATGILTVLPVQLLAYHLALERGCNPDKPRNLAKSVTVR